jgi:hypothetical protein
MKHLKIDWWVIAIIILAIMVRSIGFGQQPVGTYWDETAIWADANALVATGKDMHGLPGWQLIFPSYGDYKMPVLIWLSAVSINFFGSSALALRLPSLLAGISTVFLAYALARQIWPKQPLISRLAAVAVAVAPWSIIFSKTAFEGHIAQAILAGAAVCLLQSKRGLGWLVAATLLGTLATYTYFSVRFVWPAVVLAVFMIQLAHDHRKTIGKQALPITKLAIQTVVVPLLGFAILLLPMVRSPFYADSNRFRLNADSILKMQDWPLISNQYREFAGNTTLDRGIFHRSWLMGQELLANYADHLDLSYLFLHGDSNLRHGTGQHGLFLLIWLPALLVGMVSLWQKQPVIAAGLTLWWLTALLPASVPENTPHALRSLNALVPIALVLGYGAAQLLHSMQQHILTPSTRLLIIGICAAALTLQLGEFLIYYHTSYQQKSAAAWQADFAKTINTTIQSAQPNQPILIEHGDDKLYLWHLAQLDFSQPHQLIEQQYQMRQIDTVSYGQVTPATIQAYPGAITLTKPEKYTQLTTQTKLVPQQLTSLEDASGTYILAQWP